MGAQAAEQSQNFCWSDNALSNTFVTVPVLVHEPVCPKKLYDIDQTVREIAD